MEKDEKDEKDVAQSSAHDGGFGMEELVNASGHVQELDRNFGIWSICSLALISDNAWAAGGGSLVLA